MKVFFGSTAGSHSVIADDDVSRYSGNPTNGSNQGYGFVGWDIFTDSSNGGFAGVYRGSVNAGFGDINTGGNSFGLYGGTQNYNGINMGRNISTRALAVGYALSGIMACRWRDGSRGFSAYNSTYPTGECFNINISNSGYVIDSDGIDRATFADDMIIRVILKQTTSTNYDYSVQFKTNTPVTGSKTNGPIRALKFYCFGTPGGPNNDFFINSWKVYKY